MDTEEKLVRYRAALAALKSQAIAATSMLPGRCSPAEKKPFWFGWPRLKTKWQNTMRSAGRSWELCVERATPARLFQT